MSLYEILAAVRATSSKLVKRAILAAHKDNELLREFLKAVYDPRVNFNIKKLPDVGGYGAVEREFTMEDLKDFVNVLPSMNGGKKAKEFLKLKLAKLNWQGCELVRYLIARDVDAGIAENSVLEVWPGLFFIPPYQRCAKLDEKIKAKFAELPWFYVQTKSDGQFAYAIKPKNLGMAFESSPAQAMSRAGSIYPQWVADKITQGVPAGYVAMGEMLVVRNDEVMSRKDGNGILNSILSGKGSEYNEVTDDLMFVAWDMVTAEEFEIGRSERTYMERWKNLGQCSGLERQACWEVTSLKQAGVIQNEHLARNEEGTVWKNPNMGWRDCQSGDPDMVKAKLVFCADFEIEGVYVHKKNPDMLGGFNVKSRDGLIKFDVGSGFDDAQRLGYWRILKDNPEAFNGSVCAIEGNDIQTSKGKTTESLFLPIFVELRLDKDQADTRDEVWEEFNAAKQGRATVRL